MRVNIERDIDVKQLLINLESKSQCKSVRMAGYEVTVNKQMLRDAHDVIAQLMKETEEEKCEKKKERNGTLCDDCLMRCCCNVDCTNEHITKQMLGDLTECFGKSYGRKYATVCKTCKYKEQCKVLTKHE